MSDLIVKLVTDHGLAAILGVASILLQLWVASRLFDALRDQNRATARLLERNGIESDPPPVASSRRSGRLLPRAVTPLPWIAGVDEIREAAPEHIDPEQNTPLRRPRGRR